MTLSQPRQRGRRVQREGRARREQGEERCRCTPSGDGGSATVHGVPEGVPEEPAKTLRPSASVTVAAFAVFDPSFARERFP
jgi:hypothetical protein